jgi:glycerol-3-phosphate acyltransferase PlsX
VGDHGPLEAELAKVGKAPANVRVVASEGAIAMDAEPVAALRRNPRASIPVCVDLVKTGEAKAMVSAGHTGGCVAGAMFGLNRLPGVRRPGIGATLPSLSTSGHCVLIDVGANVNCKPVNLFQYAVMGMAVSQLCLGVTRPRVGLLSIGEEDAKGNSLVKETFRLFRQESAFDFKGNVEGRDLFGGGVDVVVCEGFVGNAVLKVAEGVSETLFRTIREEVKAMGAGGGSPSAALGGALQRLRARCDYAETGGAPLLGMDGHVQICHGRSDARAILNAVTGAIRMVDVGVNARITEVLAAHAKAG